MDVQAGQGIEVVHGEAEILKEAQDREVDCYREEQVKWQDSRAYPYLHRGSLESGLQPNIR